VKRKGVVPSDGMELTDIANFPVKLQVCAKKLFPSVSITKKPLA